MRLQFQTWQRQILWRLPGSREKMYMYHTLKLVRLWTTVIRRRRVWEEILSCERGQHIRLLSREAEIASLWLWRRREGQWGKRWETIVHVRHKADSWMVLGWELITPVGAPLEAPKQPRKEDLPDDGIITHLYHQDVYRYLWDLHVRRFNFNFNVGEILCEQYHIVDNAHVKIN